jgi:hypothetical protein
MNVSCEAFLYTVSKALCVVYRVIQVVEGHHGKG